tara:strand:+ start:316 stop:843 length:528 start_codon:yes stop_codon:yes gene_type:complete
MIRRVIVATTDYTLSAQKDLADFLFKESKRVGLYKGVSYDGLCNLYSYSIVELSTVWENLVAAIRTANGKPTTRSSEDAFDLDSGGECKLGILKKNDIYRRYVISNVSTKTGTIYFVGWNWLIGEPQFFAIPNSAYGHGLKAGIKIGVCSDCGEIKRGKYWPYEKKTLIEACMED